MRSHTRRLAAAACAALFLAIAVGNGSANRLSISERGFSVRWTPLGIADTELGAHWECDVTLAGSFHSSTLSKVEHALIGYIKAATINSCTGGRATFLRETLPWHVQYAGFTGTLPRIAGVTLLVIDLSMRWEMELTTCLARTESNHPARVRANVNAAHEVTGLRADEATRIPFTIGFGCVFFNGEFSGTGEVESESATKITIRLI